MKTHTDLEQSKKLAEILPLESADMFYRDNGKDVKLMWEHLSEIKVTSPCWSLSGLLDAMPKQVTLSGSAEDSYWYCKCEDAFNHLFVDSNNPIDACVEMILKLHERNIL